MVTAMPHNSETAGASKLQYLLDVVLQGGFLYHQGLGAVGKTNSFFVFRFIYFTEYKSNYRYIPV